MPEYIEREVVQKRIADEQAVNHVSCGNAGYEVGYHNGLSMAMAMVIKAPAADVVAVKHGRWIDGADSFGAPRGKYRVCSVCNLCIPKMSEVPEQYWRGCPNCLSKMDGGDSDA